MSMTRRELLKGFSLGTSSLLLSPILQRLQAEADGSSQLPKRFVFVVEGNGLNPHQIQPVGIAREAKGGRNSVDKLQDIPLANHAFPRALEPLTPFKDRVTIIQGLSGRICGGGHSNNFGALGCYSGKGSPSDSGRPLDETIDAAPCEGESGHLPHRWSRYLRQGRPYDHLQLLGMGTRQETADTMPAGSCL
ncbi:MAG: hypothetical protein KatS3mg105_0942 [Gemmatales bacterium]|nr:MAG: hypothetical protein KatS3mg105_0942 [Gemmatales bacterium]